MIILAFVIFRSYREKKKANILLAEQKHEIEEKNEELNQRNEEITAQRDEIEYQKRLVEEKNEEVMDSIHYARRIQSAILPREETIGEFLSDYFILYKPKDIVSGDFYWMAKRSNWLLLAVADCTGHGVPGAFMSMLGVSFLNEIVAREEVQTASHVLDEMRKYIIKSLQQRGASGEQKDGMDIAFCAINTETNDLQFAGANNPIYIVCSRQSAVGSQLIELSGDKMPVAIHENMMPFTNHVIKIQKGDTLYLMSDGYADQFGGPRGKKFYAKQLKEILLVNSHLSMAEQRELLDSRFEQWRNGYDQVDDVLIIGIKIS